VIPIVAEVFERQVRSLRRIYGVMIGCLAAIIAVTLVLGSGETVPVQGDTLTWALAALGGFSLLLLGVVVPLARRRLMSPARIRTAGPDMLRAWGVPEDIPRSIGFQAVFLTRYTAGCVISWGLTASIGLYGLVAGMLGATPAMAGLFLAAAVFVILVLPPRAGWLRDEIEKLSA